jgi:exonuclease III
MLQRVLRTVLCSAMLLLALPAQAITLTSWNLEHMMSQTAFDEWSAFCSIYGFSEDNVLAAGVKKPKKMAYCNAHNGLLFPTTIEESKPLQNKAAFEEKVSALAKRRAELDSDVFALQEAGDAASVHRIFPPDQWSVVTTTAEISQNIAFAVRKKSAIKVVSSRQIDSLAQSDDKGRSVRPGLELVIEHGGNRLVLLNVHLKASCRGQSISAPKRPGYADNARWNEIKQACNVMRKQVPALEAWIETQARAGTMFMILGDWNRDMKRDLVLPARLDPAENAQDPIADSTRIGSMIKEISDGAPKGAWIDLVRSSITARKKTTQQPGQKKSEPVCHMGIDHFALSESLTNFLGVDPKSLTATGNDYGPLAYGVDKARPSDHCPITLSLEL